MNPSQPGDSLDLLPDLVEFLAAGRQLEYNAEAAGVSERA